MYSRHHYLQTVVNTATTRILATTSAWNHTRQSRP